MPRVSPWSYRNSFEYRLVMIGVSIIWIHVLDCNTCSNNSLSELNPCSAHGHAL